MNILLVSDWGGSLALGLRLKSEGHAVRIWVKDGNYQDVGEGLLDKVKEATPLHEQPDLVICDDVGLVDLAEEFRSRRIPVWGGTDYSEKLELDRGFGQQEFAAAGMTILPEHSFDTLGEGIQYIGENPGRYVFKPNGQAQEEKILTYVCRADDSSDLLAFMQHLERSKGSSLGSFQLQKFESGVEIGISGYFNGHDFVEPIEVTFEHKKLMTGDIGPATFEMGTTLFWTTRQSRLYRETIGMMRGRLKGYVGYFDINCICHDQTMYPLEATCRFGYPTLYVNMEGLAGPLGETMRSIARGEDVPFHTSGPIAVCVVIATPPWPYTSPEVYHAYGANSLAIVGGARVDEANGVSLPAGVYPGEMRLADGEFYTAGCTGFTTIVAGHAETIEEARAGAYNTAGRISIPNMMYRTDIGANWHADMARLREWCWLD